MNAKSSKAILSDEIFLEVMNKPISFQRAFVRVTGGILPALMLSQAVFQTRCTDDPEGWFWHTQDQWEKETGMTRFEQETAREKLLKTGFWHEKRVGVPAKMHFKIDVEKLQEKLFSGIDERQEAKEKRKEAKEAKKADGDSGDNSPQTEAKAPARGKVSIKIARKQDCGNAAIQYVETPQSGLLDRSNPDCGNVAIKIAATQHTCLQQPSIQACGNVAISILERIKENEREGEIAGAPALSLSSGSDPKEKQDRAQQQETPIPPVAAAPLSPVSQAFADAAKAEFEDTQPLPGEYLPGLPVPGKRRSARLAAENIASARRLGIDEKTFRLMVDALLTGTGKMLVANGRSEDAEKVHRQAQESILEIIGYSVTTYPDETAIAKLVKSYKSYNGWQTQPPSNLQLMTHAARVVSGDVSLAGLPQQPQQTQGQPSRSNIPAGHQPAPAQYAHMNAFAKRITAGHVGEK